MADHPAPSPENVPASFETSRLRLRPWRDSDAPGPGEGPDEASLRFMPAGAQPGPDDFPAWVARRRREMESGVGLYWCIADLATDAETSDARTSNAATSNAETSNAETSSMLGNVQIFRMGPVEGRFQGELGYWLRPGARGRGVIGEALRPVIAHAFTPVENGGLGLIRLHATTDSENHSSQSILRSAGFTLCGADHQAWRRIDGSFSDGMYFELLASDLLIPELLAGSARVTTDAGPVTMEGKGIRLRAWRHTDAERVVEACSDERTRQWLGATLPWPYTLEDAHSFIAGRGEEARHGRGLYWCVADAGSDLSLGSVSIMSMQEALGTAGEVGYWTHPDARGRAVMTEAVRLVVRHAFIAQEEGGLGRRRLRLNAADGNLASQHIAIVNGFVQVGRDRQAEALADGTFADLLRFDLLADEWNTATLKDSSSY